MNENPSQHGNETQDGQREHETHWPALLLLLLAAAAVAVFFVFIARQSPTEKPLSETEKTDEFYKEDKSIEQVLEGSTPSEQIAGTEKTGLSGLPSDLYFPNEYETVRNFSADLTETTRQRVVIYDTNASIQTLKDGFTNWLNQSSFTVTATAETTIRSEDGGEQLIMSISETDDSHRVQVNYVTEK
jgi:hypothetical protein